MRPRSGDVIMFFFWVLVIFLIMVGLLAGCAPTCPTRSALLDLQAELRSMRAEARAPRVLLLEDGRCVLLEYAGVDDEGRVWTTERRLR